MSQKNRLLVVDDEESLRTVLCSELVSEGFKVQNAGDGDEAIEILNKEEFDLVLLDIKMPRVNGFDVLKHVKEKHPATKVVMLTGFADLKNAIESNFMPLAGSPTGPLTPEQKTTMLTWLTAGAPPAPQPCSALQAPP